MKTPIRLWKLFGLLALFVPAAAVAMPPLSREWRGTVTAVDLGARRLTIADTQTRSLALSWNEHTRFVVGAQFTTAEAVRRGATVEVRYRTPFFGEPFVTKVTLLSQTKSKTNPRN